MSKFSREEKLKMITDYHEQHKSINIICKEYGISSSGLRQILKQYNNEGPDNVGLGKAGRSLGKYQGQFKLSVVKERIDCGMGYREIARKYSISHCLVMKWERLYLQEGEQSLFEEHRGIQVKEGYHAKENEHIKNYNKQVKKDLIDEVQQLRMENEYLKKLNALIPKEGKSLQH